MADCAHEIELIGAGHQLIAGVDEVGRGCWAGPVVAAAVLLPPEVLHNPQLLPGVDDSKALSAAQREQAAALVHRTALAIGIGATPPHLIDAFGIIQATRLAMIQAILSLPLLPDILLIDALTLPELPLPQRALIHGDALSLSIAAASIVAKVARDRRMVDFDRSYPGYGFASHKGYGTALHTAGLAARGVTAIHRRSFRPIAELCYPEEEHQ